MTTSKKIPISVYLLVCGLFMAQSVLADGFIQGQYTVLQRDANADTYTDYYLQASAIPETIPGPYEITFDVQRIKGVNSIAIISSGASTYAVSSTYPYSDAGSWTSSAYQIVYGNFNGDAYQDILLRADTAGKPSFLVFGTDGATSPTPHIPTVAQTITQTSLGFDIAGQSLVIQDVNGDGFDDAIVNNIKIGYSDGTKLRSFLDYPAGVDADGLTDTDHDGVADRFDIDPFSNASGKTVADTDGDGVGDVDSSTPYDSNDAVTTSINGVNYGIVPGALPGTFNVTDQGKATYSLPFDLLPSIGNVMPAMGLSYSQGAGNGLVGVGWQVDGLSAITRCSTTLTADQYNNGVKLNSSDKFCLNGQRLIMISGTYYGKEDAEYRTENDSYTRIISKGTITGTVPDVNPFPKYFIVQHRDGYVEYYGAIENGSTVDAQQVSDDITSGTNEDSVVTWALKQRSDREKNSAIFNYVNDKVNGHFYIDSIDYTSNASLSAKHRVKFNYESRNDVDVKYENRTYTKQDKRLASVALQYNNGSFATVKTYYLSYLSASTYGRSTLGSVILCDKTSKNYCMANSFTWNAGAASNMEYKFTHGTDGNVSGATLPSNIQTLTGDIDNDGDDDLIWSWLENQTLKWKIYTNNGSGVYSTSPVSGNFDTNVTPYNGYAQSVLGDVDGDGTIDLVWMANVSATTLVTVAFATSGGNFTGGTSNSYSVGGSDLTNGFFFGDVNGDQRADLTYAYARSNRVGYAVYLSQGDGTFLAGDAESHVKTPGSSSNDIHPGTYQNNTFTQGDINGDGKMDLLWTFGYAQSQNSSNDNWDVYAATFLANITGKGYDFARLQKLKSDSSTDETFEVTTTKLHQFLLADMNADNKADLVWTFKDVSSTNQTLKWRVFLANRKGSGFGTRNYGSNYALPNDAASFDGEHAQLVDLSGDGRADLVYTYRENATSAGDFNWISFENGFNSGNYALTYKGDSHINIDSTATNHNYLFGDGDGDGKADLLHTFYNEGDFDWQPFLQATSYPEHLEKITNGLDEKTTITYKFMTDPVVYTKGSGATYPARNDNGKSYVVRKVEKSTGIGAAYNSWTYDYSDARTHLSGRGFLGFATREVTDNQTGFVTTRSYRLGYPYMGKVNSEVTMTGDGSPTPVSKTFNHWKEAALNSNKTVVTFLDDSVTLKYDLDSGTLISAEVTDNTYNHPYGTLTQSIVTTGKGFSGAINGSYSATGDYDASMIAPALRDANVTTVNQYTNDASSNWRLGFLTQQDVTFERSGETTKTVTHKYTPSTSSSFLIGTKTEFFGTNIEKTTTYARNTTTGTLESETITGNDIASGSITPRVTTYEDYLDGLYPQTITNPKNQVTTLAYDTSVGKLASSEDANGLTTSFKYDTFGRELLRVMPDSTRTHTQYRSCNASCPDTAPMIAAYRVIQITKNPFITGDGKPQATSYIDKLNREIRREVTGFDGTVIRSDIEYDARGRKKKISEPYFTGGTVHWNQYTYDDLDRVETETEADAGTKEYTYSADATYGSKTEVAALIQIPSSTKSINTTTYFNTLGEMKLTSDGLGVETLFFYDAQGFLRQTRVDGNTATNITIVSDVAGNKTSMVDPDAGSITYEYDALKQLRRMTQAGSDVTTNVYDTLGRMTSQTYSGATSESFTWTYDTATNGVGLLASVTGSNYQKTLGYDGLSRLNSEATKINGESSAKFFNYTFDNFSRLKNKTYPSGFAVEHSYNSNGYKTSIKDAANSVVSSGVTYWNATAMDQRTNITAESYGNGVSTTRIFYANNGLAQAIQTGVSGNTTKFQNLTYVWDSAANLYQRASASTGATTDGLGENLTEVFTYDTGHRLLTANTSGTTGGSSLSRSLSYDYDDLGNITSKTGVGTYAYSGINAGPHAVTSTTGAYANSYLYDAKGNMTSNGSKTLTYTTYNLPASISDSVSGSTVAFTYGPQEQMIYQTATENSITTESKYYEGEYEEVQQGDVIRAKTTLNGVLVYSTVQKANSAAKGYDISYVHEDHLGSTDSVTSRTATLDTRMLFDPFGSRRQPSGVDADATYLASLQKTTFETTSNGYTGHEQIDSVQLVHMGGRMYDPVLGRFLSTDANIQYPEISQSYNRYSYVLNNPLSYTDPSGEVTDGKKNDEAATGTPDTATPNPTNQSGASASDTQPPKGSGSDVPTTTKVVTDAANNGQKNEGNDKIERLRLINPNPAGDTGPTITFENDDPKGKSPNQPVNPRLAQLAEDTAKSTGISYNINSTTGGHDKGPHPEGRAFDVDKVNGRNVDDPKATQDVKKLQEALIAHPNANQVLGPVYNVNINNGKTTDVPNKKLIEEHKDHIHGNVPR